jgi:hypothetical protein
MTTRRKTIVAAGITAVAAVAVGGVATFVGREAVTPSPTPSPSSPVASAAPLPTTTTQDPSPVSNVPADFVEYRDQKNGFAISYPRNWEILEAPADPQISLIAALNQRGSFLVRVVPLGLQVGPKELPAMTSVTNQIVTSGQGIKVIAGPQNVQVGGLPGYFYLYTFTDGGQKGAHSHYFLFKGDKMITLVFQAMPEDQFQKQAPVFDQIANSFRVLPN